MTKLNKHDIRIRHSFAIAKGAMFLVALMVTAAALASGGTIYQNGVVETRALVKGPNGGYLFVQYDKNGAIVTGSGWPVEQFGKDAHDKVMSGDEYRTIVANYQAYMQANQSGIARGAYVLSADAYNNDAGNGSFYGVSYDAKGNKVEFPVKTPVLTDTSIKSVLVRAAGTIPDASVLGAQGVILMQFPIDLTPSNLKNLGTDIQSVLLNGDGQVVRTSANDIGLRAAFLPPTSDSSNDSIYTGAPNAKPMGPVSNAKVTSNWLLSTTDYTKSDGTFSLPLYFPPCPGFSFEYSYTMNVGLRYAPFNPQAGAQPGYYYFKSVPAYYFCQGYGEIPLGTTLGALDATIETLANSTLSASVISTLHIPVDVTMLSGTLTFSNLTNSGASVADPTIANTDVTGYHDDAPAATTISPAAAGLDLNGDHQPDNLTRVPDSNTYWVARLPVPSTSGTPKVATVNRVTDYAPDFNNEGLLKQISLADAENTSLYVFRQSTGKLIASEDKLNSHDIMTDSSGSPVLHYRVAIPGSEGSNAAESAIVSDPFDTGLAAPKANPHQLDSLRPGEPLTIVAVNRATGYIGTATITLKAPTTGQLDVNQADIKLAPPNLKIEAERTYAVPTGNANHLIGYQGSALASDTYVVIKTDWEDQDGSPLPDTSDGFSYTGRVAKVISGSQLQTVQGSAGTSGAGVDTNSLAEFSITPGVHTQVIRLQGPDLSTDHFYLDVSGTPKDDKPAFTTPSNSGDGNGPALSYRPSHYVPLRVPIFDEAATDQVRNQSLYAGYDVTEVPPVYQWPYRPEMAFSVLDLALQSLTVSQKTAPGTPVGTINLDQNSKNLLTQLEGYGNLDALQAVLKYDLTGGQYPFLPAIGAPPQQLIFALAGDEQLAAVSTGGSVTFSNLGSLTNGAVTGADLLTLSLYDNSDPSNILWEVEPPGLRVYYEVADDLELVKGLSIDPADPSKASKDGSLSYWTLGGMRLELTYLAPQPLPAPDYTWTITPESGAPADRYSTKKFIWTDPITESATYLATAPDDSTVYWEPDCWQIGVSNDCTGSGTSSDYYDGTLKITYLGDDGKRITESHSFHILRRIIKADAANPMQGSDVAMLENVLWHFGISPQAGDPGVSGARINSNSVRAGGWTHLCSSGAKADRRDVYTDGWVGCTKHYVSLEGMVRRFQGRNIDTTDKGSVQGGTHNTTGIDGIVGSTTLGYLGKTWVNYVYATDTYNHGTFLRTDIPDSWWTKLAAVFQTGQVTFENGDTATVSSTGTYTDSRHAAMLNELGANASVTRVDVLKAWTSNENDRHWGVNNTPYRVSEGGADEFGSIGFSQIKYGYAYGKMTGCQALKNRNIYLPENNLLGFGIWAAGSDYNCGRSFYRAFDGDYDNKYTGSGTLVGYQKAGGTEVALDGTKIITDDYVRLLKGIAGYNAGANPHWLRKCSLPDLLSSMPGSTCFPRRDALGGYAMGALHGGLNGATNKLSLPYRSYIWKGGTYPSGLPNAGKDWCFTYGEHSWLNGDSFEDTKRLALKYVYGLDPSGTVSPLVNCP